ANKHWLAEKLQPTPQAVVQQILDARIELPVKTMIGNMPEVKKQFFVADYSDQEFEKLDVCSFN
ncbi:hypothetical protein K469DRAFT_552840, partial [Zopfia rhizophila CBS 207.26]